MKRRICNYTCTRTVFARWEINEQLKVAAAETVFIASNARSQAVWGLGPWGGGGFVLYSSSSYYPVAMLRMWFRYKAPNQEKNRSPETRNAHNCAMPPTPQTMQDFIKSASRALHVEKPAKVWWNAG